MYDDHYFSSWGYLLDVRRYGLVLGLADPGDLSAHSLRRTWTDRVGESAAWKQSVAKFSAAATQRRAHSCRAIRARGYR